MNIKKWWKRKKGWQKGAIIGFILGIIFYFLLVLIYNTDQDTIDLALLLTTALFFIMFCSLIGFVIGGIKNWKNLKYWKKGAIIGFLVYLVIVIFTVISFLVPVLKWLDIFTFVLFPFAYLYAKIFCPYTSIFSSNIINFAVSCDWSLFVIFLCPLSFIIIGGVIGHIVKKR